MATRGGNAAGGEQDPKNQIKGERSQESVVLRAFGGVNLQSPREDIADNEFGWLEELIPIAAGNLAHALLIIARGISRRVPWQGAKDFKTKSTNVCCGRALLCYDPLRPTSLKWPSSARAR